MLDTQISNAPAKKDARRPIVRSLCVYVDGHDHETLNRDPITIEFSIAVVLGLLAIVGHRCLACVRAGSGVAHSVLLRLLLELGWQSGLARLRSHGHYFHRLHLFLQYR